jgi:hypothetical protein
VRKSTEKQQEQEIKEALKQNKKNIRLKETSEFLKKLIRKPDKTPEEVPSTTHTLHTLHSLCLSLSLSLSLANLSSVVSREKLKYKDSKKRGVHNTN